MALTPTTNTTSTNFGYTCTVPNPTAPAEQTTVDLQKLHQLLMAMQCAGKRTSNVQSSATKKVTVGSVFRGAFDAYGEGFKGNTVPLFGTGTNKKWLNTVLTTLLLEAFPIELIRQAVVQNKAKRHRCLYVG